MPKISLKSKDQKIWFISDLHLGHAKDFILNPRGYANVDEALADTWLQLTETIKPEDIVFNLGDAVIGAGPKTMDLAKRLAYLPCQKQYFIWGNHNAGVKQLYDDCRHELGLLADDVEIYPLNYPNSPFVYLGHYVEINIDGIPVVLTHYPITSWNEMGRGSFNIHGHCHRNLPDDPKLRRIDVGWEWQKRPVEWNEIARILLARTNKAPDHHGDASTAGGSFFK